MTFRDLGLSAPILTALEEQGYSRPTPIQEQAIPPALAGRDVLGCAQTGSGKTCGFAAPILQRLDASPAEGRPVRALVLAPTRELAIQIDDCFRDYGRHLSLRHTVIYGGVGQNPQVDALKRGCDILVATPGRLQDLHDQGFVSLERLEIFVLDEADRMLDMGFIHDVRKILKWLPRKKQTMLFSATMPPEIADLVSSLLKNPVRIAVDPVSSPVEAIEQQVCMVDRTSKTQLLAWLMEQLHVKNALIFTRTKHGANKVAKDLEKMGIAASAIHGNKSQTARQQALADFKSGTLRALVATDIAARGLDIEELSHVFNYNLPDVPETYVHRIGRTGRAGRGGCAVSFCDSSEIPMLKDIEKLLGHPVPVMEDHPWPMQNFDEPVRDRNGRIVNEEDAEARAAARELRREKDEARKAAAKEKRKEDAEAAARAVQVLSQSEPDSGRKSRRDRKKQKDAPRQQESTGRPAAEETPSRTDSAPAEGKKKKDRGRKKDSGAREPEPPAAEPAPPPAETSFPEDGEDDYEPYSYASYLKYSGASRPRQARPGTFFDTGDAMPNTEFSRPDPLAGDSIMDATARLLAPRTPPAPAPAPEPAQGGKRGRTREKKAEPPARQSSGKQQAQPKKGKETAKPSAQSAPKQEKGQAKGQNRDRGKKQQQAVKTQQGKKKSAAGQSAPAKPKAETKEGKQGGRKQRSRGGRDSRSGEQATLMKPFYLSDSQSP